MTSEDQNVLASIICTELENPGLALEAATVIRELPGIESMKVLRIIAKIERKFGVELDDEVVFNIGTFGDLMGALDKARAEASL